jgi:hypothetical protein
MSLRGGAGAAEYQWQDGPEVSRRLGGCRSLLRWTRAVA